jgi:hypothetical protein
MGPGEKAEFLIIADDGVGGFGGLQADAGGFVAGAP